MKTKAISDQSKVRLLELYRQTVEHTHRGQALDMNARFSWDFSTAEYFRIVTEKTGYYLSATAIAAAMIADRPQSEIQSLEAVGKALGPLFQITDDLLDLQAEKGRDRVGSDIREGKRSFLVAKALEVADDRESIRLLEILDLGRDETTDQHVSEVVRLFEKYDIIESARLKCQELREAAERELGNLPKEVHDLLLLFISALSERKS